jgi:hypothetical protein
MPPPSPEVSWEGLAITAADINGLKQTRRIPDGMECRLLAGEIAPTMEDNELVIFLTQFEQGFGLLVSDFLRSFLDFFGLQHQFPANAFLSLSCFSALCEAYLGLWPSFDLWSRLFYLKAQYKDGELQARRAACIYPRPNSVSPKMSTVE